MPLPAVMIMPPARPPDEAPVPSDIAPLFPPHAVPELNMSRPLPPPVPLLLVLVTTVPLLVCLPSPLVIVIKPPLASMDRPD